MEKMLLSKTETLVYQGMWLDSWSVSWKKCSSDGLAKAAQP